MLKKSIWRSLCQRWNHFNEYSNSVAACCSLSTFWDVFVNKRCKDHGRKCIYCFVKKKKKRSEAAFLCHPTHIHIKTEGNTGICKTKSSVLQAEHLEQRAFGNSGCWHSFFVKICTQVLMLVLQYLKSLDTVDFRTS